MEQEESFSYPVRPVLVSAGYSLKQLNFDLKKVEFPGDRGLIKASAHNTRVTLHINSVTPNLTLMRSKITTTTGERYYSSEEELFNGIHRILNGEGKPSLRDVGAGMATVHLAPDMKSQVIAFIAQGEEVSIRDEAPHSDWQKIKLESGDIGYVSTKNIIPAKMKTKERKV